MSKYISHQCVESDNVQRVARCASFRRDIEAQLGFTNTKRKHDQHSERPRKRQKPEPERRASGPFTLESALQHASDVETSIQPVSAAKQPLQAAPAIPCQVVAPAVVEKYSEHRAESHSLFDSVSGLDGDLGAPGLWWDLVSQWTETPGFTGDI